MQVLGARSTPLLRRWNGALPAARAGYRAQRGRQPNPPPVSAGRAPRGADRRSGREKLPLFPVRLVGAGRSRRLCADTVAVRVRPACSVTPCRHPRHERNSRDAPALPQADGRQPRRDRAPDHARDDGTRHGQRRRLQPRRFGQGMRARADPPPHTPRTPSASARALPLMHARGWLVLAVPPGLRPLPAAPLQGRSVVHGVWRVWRVSTRATPC